MCEKEKVCTSSGLKDTLHIRMLHLQKEKKAVMGTVPSLTGNKLFSWPSAQIHCSAVSGPDRGNISRRRKSTTKNQEVCRRTQTRRRFRVEHAAAEQRRVWIFIFVQAEVTWAEESSASHLSHIQVFNLTTVKGCIIISCCRWLHLSAAKVMLLL